MHRHHRLKRVQVQLSIAQDLLEEVRSFGFDVSSFEARLSEAERILASQRLGDKELEECQLSIEASIKDLSDALGQAEKGPGKELPSIEAEVYEYIMKHGGMSLSRFSQEHGFPKGDVEKAIERLVNLGMIEVRGGKFGRKRS